MDLPAISQLSVSLTCKMNAGLYSKLAINIVYQYHFSLILWLIYHFETIGHSFKVLNAIPSVITLIWFYNWQILRSNDRIDVGKK